MIRKPAPLRFLFHVATGLTLAYLVYFMGKEEGGLLIGSLFLVTVLIEALRLMVPAINGVFMGLVGPMLKDVEMGRPTGVGYFLGGALTCLLLFDVEVTLASLAILSVGDPAAAAVGQRWGRIRIGKKSLEGLAAFFVATMVSGMILRGFWPGLSMPVFAIGALTGAVVECLPLKVDDNLILPLAAALAMELSIRYL